jgi:hypothetical protein
MRPGVGRSKAGLARRKSNPAAADPATWPWDASLTVPVVPQSNLRKGWNPALAARILLAAPSSGVRR